MASTGPPVITSSTTVTSTSTVTGQGFFPLFRCRVSFDDVLISTPTWTDLSSRLRSFDITRGRTNELAEFDTGSASIVLDNRDRTLDPNVTATVRPLNRVWFYEEFSGEVHDLFRGYVTAWQQSWDPSGIVDATATITASDEFLVLSQAALATTNPPRETYQDLVMADGPVAYWDMHEDPTQRQRLPTLVDGEQPTSSTSGSGTRRAIAAAPLRTDFRHWAYPAARRKH